MSCFVVDLENVSPDAVLSHMFTLKHQSFYLGLLQKPGANGSLAKIECGAFEANQGMPERQREPEQAKISLVSLCNAELDRMLHASVLSSQYNDFKQRPICASHAGARCVKSDRNDFQKPVRQMVTQHNKPYDVFLS